MSEPQHAPGTIGWTDLTVPDAEALRDFYVQVVGWRTEPLDMGGYSDFVMKAPATDAPVAGICHARGPNADIPPQWLVYINVANIETSVAACAALGGRVVVPTRPAGGGRFCVIRDPAGAVCGLFEPPPA